MMPREKKSSRRFFVPVPLTASGQEITLEKSETRHLKDVLRLQTGDSCQAVDGLGHEAEVIIQTFTAEGQTRLRVNAVSIAKPASLLPIKVYLALAQRGKMDYLVEKAQELAIPDFFPLITERTVVKLSADDQQKVLERWLRIAKEAVKQARALNLMKLYPPVRFKDAFKSIPKGETAVVFHPDAASVSFPEFASGLTKKDSLHIFIGPEGGFSPQEIELARSHGAKIVELGETLLKVDTAFIGVLSALRFLFP